MLLTAGYPIVNDKSTEKAEVDQVMKVKQLSSSGRAPILTCLTGHVCTLDERARDKKSLSGIHALQAWGVGICKLALYTDTPLRDLWQRLRRRNDLCRQSRNTVKLRHARKFGDRAHAQHRLEVFSHSASLNRSGRHVPVFRLIPSDLPLGLGASGTELVVHSGEGSDDGVCAIGGDSCTDTICEKLQVFRVRARPA